MKKRFSFYVMMKDFNTGKIEYYDVMPSLYGSIFNQNGTLSKSKFYVYGKDYKMKPITTKSELKIFVDSHFRYCYWAKCEWEFIVRDWPSRKEKERDVKVDVYEQLKPNIDLIVDMLWNQIKEKLKK